MTQKETNLRSVLFLVIGILLLLSLIICIYIVSGESDLVETTAVVEEIHSTSTDTKEVQVTVAYDVNGQPYKFKYNHKGEVKKGDKVTLYYHEKKPISVQTYKTKKIIFIWPILGLALCILGIFELFRKNDDDDDDDELETSVIGVVGNTQQLKIVTDDTEVKEYEKTPEEEKEVEVKTVSKEVAVDSSVVDASSAVEEVAPAVDMAPETASAVTPEPVVVTEKVASEPTPKPVAAPLIEISHVELPKTVELEIPQQEVVVQPATVAPVAPAPVAPTPVVEPVQAESVQQQQPKMVEAAPSPTKSVEDAIAKKVQSNIGGAAGLNEEDIKKVIKDVLKEVIQEVKEEKVPATPVIQKKVIPNNYYIVGTSLIYEEAGKDPQEVELKTIKSIVRTINSAGNVVKLVVSNEAVKCVLTNMKNIDLEQLAGLLNNKMRTIDEDFKEEIEYKEY